MVMSLMTSLAVGGSYFYAYTKHIEKLAERKADGDE